ncbi:polyprenol phosphomannose-dependent alpha 1,6 mannosyltransferase MptB [Enemella evansiae]|uniref:polyprenol phosphomannose-dependent alpha 1,6 mannosyltransferase MptB n=1 Tax=Enemella evansiae TaxID=2016499 RepID=UPI000B95E927|nr:polyprenol phosphomannose-dependent alpha 1,6 mannosyltransferase MptB [Enemella evansiae]OYO00358.1 hypothetical protein CGZ96_05445 [Enemella evansiae]OYO03652.1 hypothetical protein CGZ97_09510 [Enemella evansiae]PFG68414.1 alpha-1,6-mannosyltransferase/alpha-1,6-mannosyltransferase [Propionibacteriaceae bacterium ES.041]
MQQSGPVQTVDARPPGLVATLRIPGVLLGMLGMLCIGIAVMTPGFVPNASLDQIAPLRILRSVLKYQVGRALMAIGLALLIWAWLKLRPARVPLLNHSWVLVLWSLPVLLAPPIFSSDAFLYADQGWIIHQGLDPYEVGLTEAGGPFAINVHKVWRGTTSIYPPFALLVQYWVAVATGFQGLISVIAMRIPILIAVAVIAVFVPMVARQLGADVQLAKWFAILNPLLLIHFVGGMHNDAMMVALVLVAIWCTLRFGTPGMIVGALLVGVGATFKQPGIIAAFAIGLLPVAVRLKDLAPGRRLLVIIGRSLVSCGLAAASFTAVSLAIGFEFMGWRHAANIGELTWGMSPASIVEQFIGPVLNWVGIRHGLLPFLSRVTTVLSVLMLGVLAWRYFFPDVWIGRRVRNHSVQQVAGAELPETDRSWRDHPIRWLTWGFSAIAFSGAGYHVWYLLWGGIYVGMLRYPNRLFRALIGVMILFIVVEGGLEYYGMRPIVGYLVGAALGWIFWANSTRLQIVPEPAPEAETAEERPTAVVG